MKLLSLATIAVCISSIVAATTTPSHHTSSKHKATPALHHASSKSTHHSTSKNSHHSTSKAAVRHDVSKSTHHMSKATVHHTSTSKKKSTKKKSTTKSTAKSKSTIDVGKAKARSTSTKPKSKSTSTKSKSTSKSTPKAKVKSTPSTPVIPEPSDVTSVTYHSVATPAANSKIIGELQQNDEWLTGVAAMHAILVNERKILIIDKAEYNPALFDDGTSAWSSYYDIEMNEYYALTLETNTFCSGGGFLGNGTLVSTGGSGTVGGTWGKGSNGFQTTREFTPCNADSFQNQTCDWIEFPTGSLSSNRWYPTIAQLPDGSIIIVGGCNASVAVNAADINNPTYEFWPPRNGSVNFSFLVETLPYNLYPIVYLLPSGYLFIFANKQSIVFDYKNDKVIYTLPNIPGNNSRSYPLTSSSVLLPLSPTNNYTAEVLICGGSSRMDKKAKGDNTCGRIVVAKKTAWVMETMNVARIMPDMVLQADGKVFISNGCSVGFAGYASASFKGGPYTPKCSSPVLSGSIYDPNAEVNKRFTNDLPTSKIPRLYHSVSLLVPDGRVWIAGSNPVDPPQTKGVPFPTEYRVEYYNPPYLFSTARPVVTSVPAKISYGKTFTVTVNLKNVKANIKVALINSGFVTHSTHMSQRYLILESSLKGTTLTIHAPPDSNLFPPGPGFLYVLNNEVPAIAPMVMVS